MNSKTKYIGYCIYCNLKPLNLDELTEEHIAAEAIMGDYVLEKASCINRGGNSESSKKTCSDITSYFELRTCRGLFGPIREHLKYYGKRRKKRRPKLFITFENSDGTEEKKTVSLLEYPLTLSMPILPPPGILMGLSRGEGFPKNLSWQTYTHDSAQRLIKKLSQSDPQKRPLKWDLDAGNLTKVLAKIAYGFSVYFMDETFDPLITELILAPQDDAILGPYFVGSIFEQKDALQIPLSHERLHEAQIRKERVGDHVYIIARIHLFSSQGMPIYDVVVGTVNS